MVNYQKQSHYSQDQSKDAHDHCYFSILYCGLAHGERQEKEIRNVALNRDETICHPYNHLPRKSTETKGQL